MSCTVITAALPTRGALLAECIQSVNGQTVLPDAHLVGIDHARRGSSYIRNALLEASRTEWIAVLDDDDLMLSNHLESLMDSAEAEGADIVYSFCSVVGRPGWNPNRGFDPFELRKGNYIPATTLIRRSLLFEMDGWKPSDECLHGWEDYDLWLRALDAGAKFACVPAVTWVYRFFPGRNKTYVGERAAS